MAEKKATGKKRITLACSADPDCKVFIAGTFNNWDPRGRPMKPVDGNGHYKATLVLPRGEHQYKFVVGDDWRLDENNPQWVPNGFGSLNSVVSV